MFLDITAFGKEAEACSQHLHKGRRIGFDGRLQHCAWVDDDGSKRSKFSGAGHVEFLDNAPRADAAGAPETTPVVASAEGDRAGGGTAGELVSRESRARPGHRGVARLHVERRDFERPVDCSPQSASVMIHSRLGRRPCRRPRESERRSQAPPRSARHPRGGCRPSHRSRGGEATPRG